MGENGERKKLHRPWERKSQGWEEEEEGGGGEHREWSTMKRARGMLGGGCGTPASLYVMPRMTKVASEGVGDEWTIWNHLRCGVIYLPP